MLSSGRLYFIQISVYYLEFSGYDDVLVSACAGEFMECSTGVPLTDHIVVFMSKLKIGVIGCGFWSGYQIPAWLELEGVEVVAVCDRSLDKARSTAARFSLPRFYDDPEALLNAGGIDVVDIITDVNTHAPLVSLAAHHHVSVICQKPMAPDYQTAVKIVAECRRMGVPFFVHENFRWQLPLRRLKAVIDSGVMGSVFKARISFTSAFPVFENQPFLKEIDQFILADVGSHIFDVARFLLGEAKNLYCRTQTVTPGVKGEDVANVLLEMRSGAHCFIEMSYASILEKEVFPQTLVLLEGEKGSVELAPDFLIKVTTRDGTTKASAHPPVYAWAHPDYAVIHSSMVEINRNFRDALLSGGQNAETSAEDNLNTIKLVYAAYASAAENTVIELDQF